MHEFRWPPICVRFDGKLRKRLNGRVGILVGTDFSSNLSEVSIGKLQVSTGKLEVSIRKSEVAIGCHFQCWSILRRHVLFFCLCQRFI